MMTSVIINDYVHDNCMTISMDDNDFDKVIVNWKNGDQLLADMQTVPLFQDKTRWCDLDPTHWRVLILNALEKVDGLSPEQQHDVRNPVVDTLSFCVCGLIRCIEQRSESRVELLHINRVNAATVSYDYAASLNLAVDVRTQQPMLRVVVDN